MSRAPGGHKLEMVPTETTYSIEVPKEKALALFKKETGQGSLYDALTKIEGVSDANYDAHFGPYVFVTVEADDDSAATKLAICNLVQSYMTPLRLVSVKEPERKITTWRCTLCGATTRRSSARSMSAFSRQHRTKAHADHVGGIRYEVVPETDVPW